ncbi:MFS transporter [Neorhizobium alkalisoli]|uniref:Sugar phosphate permease n=1 Tax=Neorhizobium alkalisoli TaxID=528178 RepID=A0A561QRI2_9HYPH|nr:MFS transporter [Neorhizobium alkalisoli]TWF52964.1 sugar phosphate permease [Neorhizobium alkalisoli]
MSSNYRWVIVFAGGLMGCVAMGAMFSLAIFLAPIAEATGWSHAGISSAMTVNFIVMGIGSFFWGAASDRFGARVVVLIGSLILGLALVLASRVETLIAFQLVYGCLVGLSASAFFAPMMSVTMAWFDKNRGLAVSLVSAGMGMAPMTVSPIARWLITDYGDWRFAMLVIGIGAWVILVPTAMLVRNPPVAAAGAAPETEAEGAGMPLSTVFRSPQFLVLGFTFFACCAAHSGPIFHMVSYAMTCGVAPMAAVTIYSVEGAAGLGGRILYGLLADRVGVKPVLIIGLLIQAVVIAAYTLASDLSHFYMLAIIFGGTYGGVMPLYAVLAREYFGPKILGTVLGAASMLSSIGMAFGPLAGGWAFDAFNNYNGLFLGSALVGLGAVLIALFFPPLPGREAEKLQPA